MKSINASLLACLLSVFLISVGCKTQEKADKSLLRKKNPHYLLQKLKQNELEFEWLSARAATNAKIEDKNLDITVKIRIRKDSAIWLSISPALGIEIARAVITQNSLMFLNRLEKNYFAGSIAYLNKLAPMEINYKLLQSLVTGNNIVVGEDKEDEKPEKYKVEIDDGKYLLSTLKSKKYHKTLQGKKPGNDMAKRIWLMPTTFKIAKGEINNFKTSKKIIASYDQFETVEGQSFARIVDIVMQAEQDVTVNLSYSKVTLNKPLKMPYRIPSKYEPLE